MKTNGIVFSRDNLIGSVTALLESLEPADLLSLEQQCQRLDEFRRFVAFQILKLPNPFHPGNHTPTPIDAAELNELEDHVRKLEERYDAKFAALADELAGLHRFAVAQAERIAAQSEMLARRAEAAAPPEFVATTPAETASVKSPDSDAATIAPHELPEPSANGKHSPRPSDDSRRRLAAMLANGPLTLTALAEAAPDITYANVKYLIQSSPWFARVNPDNRLSPWTLTPVGRAALAESGFVLVPAATPAAPPAPRPELTPQERAHEQCRLIAAAIAAAGKPLLPDEIAREAALPPDVVTKRLARQGPQALPGGKRYFCESAKEKGCWRLTNSGEALAKEGGA